MKQRKPRTPKNIVGKKTGYLTVVKFYGSNGSQSYFWECECKCGKNIIRSTGEINRKRSFQSCGCAGRKIHLEIVTTHGMSKWPEYMIWASMLERCRNPKTHNKIYRKRKIKVCKKWYRFENFIKDMGRRPTNKYSIDRIDNNKGYSSKNCRWATITEQVRNKSTNKFITYKNITLTYAEWGRRLSIPRDTICRRMQRNWPIELVFSKIKVIPSMLKSYE